MCSIDGCERPVNRDGLCLTHKLKTVRSNMGHLRRERNGEDATGGMGTEAFVRDMYEKRRAAGLPDPEPANKEAARYAPAAGIHADKKYRQVNS